MFKETQLKFLQTVLWLVRDRLLHFNSKPIYLAKVLEIADSPASSPSLRLSLFSGKEKSAVGTSPLFACQGCHSWTPLVS